MFRNILISVLGIGVIGTYGALLTLLISLKYLSPMIVALSCLIQPIIAQVFATAFGLEGMPGFFLVNIILGPMTMIGGAIVLAGLFAVSQSAPVEKPRKASLRASSICDPLMQEGNTEKQNGV